ncbi:hypothetical protein AXF42_Ash003301 [Apostasia shenzhenica]|uniref:Uncharacterized protein n=1 Tax=Apostasia shenzhenica TaxID=1088818 RepID=A0A2I0BFU8_9ASPA|nr:hypothetical protein AXF42_Ash003301 [Apostasia shenzhenica]
MSMFSGVVGFVRDEPPEVGGPAQSGQASVRWPPTREEALKRPQIRLSNSGGGACATSRSLQGSVHVTPSVDSTVIVADDEVQPVGKGLENQPSFPLTTEVLNALSQDRSTLTPVSSSVGPEISSVGGQKGPSSGSSSAQFFARSICSQLDKVEKWLASRGQAAVLKQKMEEALTLHRKLELSEVEKAITELESKCARFEGDLESAVVKIEGLEKERAVLVAPVEELEEENCHRREFARAVRGLLAELKFRLSP